VGVVVTSPGKLSTPQQSMSRWSIDAITAATAEPVASVRYMLRMLALAIIPTLTIGISIAVVFQFFGSDFFIPVQKNDPKSIAVVVSAIIVAPIAETLLMIPVLWLLGLVIKQPARIAALSAVLWGIVHVFSVGPFGLVTSWPFFIFSLMMLARRDRSFRSGYWRVVICHSLYNAVLFGSFFIISMAIE
jgi:hypothetical protein